MGHFGLAFVFFVFAFFVRDFGYRSAIIEQYFEENKMVEAYINIS